MTDSAVTGDIDRKSAVPPGPVSIKDIKGLRVVKPGDRPPCLASGQILCRGCPGWWVMIQAARDADSLWAQSPIHCSATGLTVRRLK